MLVLLFTLRSSLVSRVTCSLGFRCADQTDAVTGSADVFSLHQDGPHAAEGVLWLHMLHHVAWSQNAAVVVVAQLPGLTPTKPDLQEATASQSETDVEGRTEKFVFSFHLCFITLPVFISEESSRHAASVSPDTLIGSTRLQV